MKRILLDVDGVVADFTGRTLSMVRGIITEEEYQASLSCWGLLEPLPEEIRNQCMNSWVERGWCSSIPHYPEAIPGYDLIKEHGRVVWVTAPLKNAPYWCHERTLWLAEKFSAKLENIVFTHDKSHVWGDFLVDDRIENVDAWAEAHPNSTAILWDRPYNKNWEIKKGNVKRASSWKEVLEIIEST